MSTRWSAVAAAALMSVPFHPDGALLAQSGCGQPNRLWRTTVGASLGSWVGLVAMKIRYSDWSDASRGASAVQARNRGIVIGAVLGASIGNLRFAPACRVTPATRAPLPRAHRSIMEEEIIAYGTSATVYDLVHARRRQWLNTRGIDLAETPRLVANGRGTRVTPAENPTLVVYLDNVRAGDQEILRSIPLDGVTEVRYFDAAEATYRWGTGHNHGAIQVLTVTRAER